VPEAEVAQRFESQTLFALTDGREVTGLATGVIEEQTVIAVSTQSVVVGQEGAWLELFSADETGAWTSVVAYSSPEFVRVTDLWSAGSAFLAQVLDGYGAPLPSWQVRLLPPDPPADLEHWKEMFGTPWQPGWSVLSVPSTSRAEGLRADCDGDGQPESYRVTQVEGRSQVEQELAESEGTTGQVLFTVSDSRLRLCQADLSGNGRADLVAVSPVEGLRVAWLEQSWAVAHVETGMERQASGEGTCAILTEEGRASALVAYDEPAEVRQYRVKSGPP
jgi:hypothetical protein